MKKRTLLSSSFGTAGPAVIRIAMMVCVVGMAGQAATF